MPVEFKSAEQHVLESFERLTKNTPVTNLSPGGTARAMLEIIASFQEDQNQFFQDQMLQTFVTTATGQYLDKIAEVFGIDRRGVTYAVDTSGKNFRFYIDSATGLTANDLADIASEYLAKHGLADTNILANGFRIPAGTEVYTGGGVSYHTTESVLFQDTDKSKYVNVISSNAGILGNVGIGQLRYHNLGATSPGFSAIGNLILANNAQPITTGSNLETDQNLRYRIVNATNSIGQANETAVRLAALSVPGVRDVRLRKYSHGIGTFTVFVIGDHPIVSDGLLGAVQAGVSNVSAVGMRAFADRPTYRSISLGIRLKFVLGTSQQESLSLQREVRRQVVTYINNIEIGGRFVINELIQVVMDTSEKIEDTTIFKLNIGIYSPTTSTINGNIPVLVTNQSLEWDEQFFTKPDYIEICTTR